MKRIEITEMIPHTGREKEYEYVKNFLKIQAKIPMMVELPTNDFIQFSKINFTNQFIVPLNLLPILLTLLKLASVMRYDYCFAPPCFALWDNTPYEGIMQYLLEAYRFR